MEGNTVSAYRESSEPKAHASLTAVFIQEMLQERGLSMADCDAVCVSMGPGSYTGLRVGVSTAKGLCFGAGIPLLAVGTLDVLVAQASSASTKAGDMPEFRYVVPMIDARRMEVYSAVFSPDGRQLTETAPAIIDQDSFADRLAEGPVLFIGDGAGKCRETLNHPNAYFLQCHPEASSMADLALARLEAEDFKDVAYFEPFYLKEFVATASKKKLF